MRSVLLSLLVALLAVPGRAPAPPAAAQFELDHVWLVVSPGAPERAALERPGLRVAPTVNRHDGQGTASITVEFANAFLELMWVEPSVSVAPGSERVREKFLQKSKWRTSGWSPVGIGIRRTAKGPDQLPFPTWPIKASWMPDGTALEMITPAADSQAPSVWVLPRVMAIAEGADAERARLVDHRLGVRRLTGLRLVQPPRDDPDDPTKVLTRLGLAKVEPGDAWLVELTLDGGVKGQSRDLRPDPSSPSCSGTNPA